jgi:23S rRNA (cytosine1962-C5)-methyltransferase
MYPSIHLHKGKEVSLQRRHPWVFSGAIHKKSTDLKDGDVVEVFSSANTYLGIGYYANGSIAVRLISFVKTNIDVDFWKQKIQTAYNYRQELRISNESTNVYRLFFGEGDGASGLILDNYNGHIVLQAHSVGIYRMREMIAKAIQSVLGKEVKSIYDKSAETLPKAFQGEAKNGFLVGSAQEVIVYENNVKFEIDFINGQKTGFFIDQRDNRALLQKYSKDKAVLNTFCYSGGFSIYAALADAKKVDSIDVSEKAIALTDKNASLNQIQHHQSFASDTFDFLKDKKNMYDIIVLDPPAFAKSRDSKHQAVIGYKRLNEMAMRLIKSNGILFTFSCSGVVDKFLFYNTITAAAIEAKRQIKVLHYLHQPADHPVTPYFPEGEYLKGMVLFVE